MKKNFHGFINIDDLQYADRVSIFASEIGLHFRRGDSAVIPGMQIGLYPLPASALITSPERMRTGFYYSIQGTEVGGCSDGIYREPGEANIWPVVEFTIAVKYGQETLTIGASGTTGQGRSGSGLPRALDPWKFRIEVRIPRNVIAEALNLQEPERRFLQRSWDALDADA